MHDHLLSTAPNRKASSIPELVERLILEYAAGGITARTKQELADFMDLIARRLYHSQVGFQWSAYHERQLLKLAQATKADGGLTAWNLRTNKQPKGNQLKPVLVIAVRASPHRIFVEPYWRPYTAKFRQIVSESTGYSGAGLPCL